MGKHSLAVVVTPQGQYSGITNRLSIDIERIPIQTEIQVPQLITITKPSQVSGKIYHNLNPIADAGVKLISKGFSSTTKTTTDGSFTTTIRPPRLSIPIDLSLIGPQELAITIEPVEPWYAPLQIKRWVFTFGDTEPSNRRSLVWGGGALL